MAQIEKKNFYVYSGSAKRLEFTFVSDGVAWDGMITATGIVLSVKHSLDEDDVLFEVDYDADESALEYGKVQFLISSAQTALLTENAVYDVRVEGVDSFNIYPVYGDVLVQQRVGVWP